MVLSQEGKMSNYNTLLEDKDMGFKTPLEQANEYIERLNRRIAELYAEIERLNKLLSESAK
jgi:polyhydroxyalkanoate synthesis regulator phasin